LQAGEETLTRPAARVVVGIWSVRMAGRRNCFGPPDQYFEPWPIKQSTIALHCILQRHETMGRIDNLNSQRVYKEAGCVRLGRPAACGERG